MVLLGSQISKAVNAGKVYPCIVQCTQGGEIIFFVAWIFLKPVWQNGKTKKDTNARVAGIRKQTKM